MGQPVLSGPRHDPWFSNFPPQLGSSGSTSPGRADVPSLPVASGASEFPVFASNDKALDRGLGILKEIRRPLEGRRNSEETKETHESMAHHCLCSRRAVGGGARGTRSGGALDVTGVPGPVRDSPTTTPVKEEESTSTTSSPKPSGFLTEG